MSPQQLERFTREYAALAQQAEQAGVSVDKTLKQVRSGWGKAYWSYVHVLRRGKEYRRPTWRGRLHVGGGRRRSGKRRVGRVVVQHGGRQGMASVGPYAQAGPLWGALLRGTVSKMGRDYAVTGACSPAQLAVGSEEGNWKPGSELLRHSR